MKDTFLSFMEEMLTYYRAEHAKAIEEKSLYGEMMRFGQIETAHNFIHQYQHEQRMAEIMRRSE